MSNTSLPPPPPPTSGNAMYLAIAGVVGVAMIGLIVWRFSGGPTPPTAQSVPATSASALNPSQVRPDNVPPPAADVPDSGDTEVDSGGKVAAAGSNGCDMKVCKGATSPALETALRSRASQTRNKCYQPALNQDESLQGHITLNVRVGTNGQVCSSTVGSNDNGLAGVAQCVAATFRGARLPSPSGGCVDLAVPVSFTSGH